jgi:hypothetical protein
MAALSIPRPAKTMYPYLKVEAFPTDVVEYR